MVELYKGNVLSDPTPLQDQTDIGHMTAEGDWVIPSMVEGHTVELEYYLGTRCIKCPLPFEEALYSRKNSTLILLCKKASGEVEPRLIACDCVFPKLGQCTS